MSLQSLCTGYTVTLEQPIPSQDSSGGPTRPFTVVATGLSCSLQPASAHTQMMFMQKDIRMNHQAFFSSDITPAGLSIRAGWRLTVTGGKNASMIGRHAIIQGYGDEAGQGRMFVADLDIQL